MTGKGNEKIAVLGAGSWGATLACLFAAAGCPVKLWTRDEEKASKMQKQHRLERPIEVDLPALVECTADLAGALDDAAIIVVACPSQTLRDLTRRVATVFSRHNVTASEAVLAPQARSGSEKRACEAKSSGFCDHPQTPVLVSAVKGIELQSLKRMSQVIEDELPGFPICALSGPNLAPEIVRGLPCASVVASQAPDVAQFVQSILSQKKFRLYTNDDLIGVELGGSLKNVIAIAAGVTDGLKLGYNAKAALLTRGLAEMTRLAVAMGGQPKTLAGLAGMGDLLATCAGPVSRNYQLGAYLAEGFSLQAALLKVGAAVEGIPTTEAVCELSKQLKLELPIADRVQATLNGKTTPEGAIMTLMGRPLVSE